MTPLNRLVMHDNRKEQNLGATDLRWHCCRV